jgi:CheY-like chemotaxis protein
VSLRCLIVDDNAEFVRAAQRLLEGQGLVVVGTVTSSADAVRQAEFLLPDVVLVDIDLGDESGFDVADRLAGGCPHHRPYVILVSTHDQSDFSDLIDESPALGFIAKTDLCAAAISSLVEEADEAASAC